MNRPVDVLAVLDCAIETSALVPDLAASLKQARSVVAELFEAADAGDPDSFGQILFYEREGARLIAALAAARGAA